MRLIDTSALKSAVMILAVLAQGAFAQKAAGEDEESGINQKRFEWFYRQRAYPFGSFSPALRVKALAEMEQRVAKKFGSATSSGQWRSIGPQPIGASPNQYSGRVNTLVIDPRSANVVYVGVDGGGVWKTPDGGLNWLPLTDTQPSLTIGSLALATWNPNVVFAATGYSSNGGTGAGAVNGAGILVSSDGGDTWTQTGGPLLNQTVTSVATQPAGGQVVLAAGNWMVVRSADGGATWTPVLNNFYTTQVLFDPTDGNRAYAVGLNAGGAGFGIQRSVDGGLTWAPLNGTGTNVLQTAHFNYLTMAVSPSNPNVLYAAARLSSPPLPAFYKSVDGGLNWTLTSTPHGDVIDYWGWSLTVHPTNPDIVYAGSLFIHRTTDGGASWSNVTGVPGPHVDHHVQAFTADGSRLYIGNDGGVWSTTGPAAASVTWSNLNTNLSTTLFYPGISIDPANVDRTFGGTQDNGTLRYEGSMNWPWVTCGDGAYTAIDFQQPQNVYGNCQEIDIRKSTSSGDPSKPWIKVISGIDTSDRVMFIPPLVMDPGNPQNLYFGTYRIYQTRNAATAWTAISPDLTAGGAALTAIAVAPSDSNTIYAGAFGRIAVTRNALAAAGSNWSTSTNGLPNRAVTQIAVHPRNPLVAYAALSGYGTGHVFTTADGGQSWTDTGASNLPDVPLNDILIDPDQFTTLYAATDIGVFRSQDSGASWVPLANGLPRAIVSAIRFHRPSRTLRAATYGRGMWDLWVPVGNQVLITIGSSVAGAAFQLEDGTVFQAPATFSWTPGDQHTVTWLGSVAGQAGARYTFQSWADGGANPRVITVPPATTTFTANLRLQYRLTLVVSPAPGGTITATPSSADGYYDAGTSVTLTAAAATGYGFSYIGGDVFTNQPSYTAAMTGPLTITANFYCSYRFFGVLPNQAGPLSASGALIWQTGAGCSASVASDSAWITTGPPSSNGSLNFARYSITANSGATRQGTVTFTGSDAYSLPMNVTQDPAGVARPVLVSLSPDAGTGGAQVFTLKAADASGYGNLNFVSFAITDPATNTQCYTYVNSLAGQPSLWLLEAGTLLGPLRLPSNGKLQNGVCTLDGASSSVTGAGNIVTITLGVSFSKSFKGDRYLNASAGDTASGFTTNASLGTWTVTDAAVLGISKSHTGNFTQGQIGATYSVTVSNAASAGVTSGPVTVTDSAPAGLAVISMAGSGWVCPGGSNTCTRNDPLAPGASYPPIVVTANIAANAPASVINQASVSGGGSIPAVATDPAAVNPAPVVTGPASLSSGTIGLAYPPTTITASGGTQPYQWTASGLPVGLGIHPGTGVISGTPTAAGSFSVTATVTDSLHVSASKTYSLSVVVPFTGSNLALGKSATQSSIAPYPNAGPGGAVDGNTDGNYFNGSVTHTNSEPNAWWQVDLGVASTLSTIVVWNRTDCCASRLSNYWVFVSNTPFGPTDTPASLSNRAGTWSGLQVASPSPSTTLPLSGVQGRYVRVQLAGTDYLSLAEVQVFGSANPLTITGPASLPAGIAGAAYPATTVTATGGAPSYKWSATGLPPGLAIDQNTGTIGGMPASAAGSPFSVTVTVTDSVLGPASKTYSLTINPAPQPTNLALGKTATQSSIAPYPNPDPAGAVDGNTDGNYFNGSVTHTNSDPNAWWQVDLGAAANINSLVVWNRTDCCASRLSNFWVFVSSTPFGPADTPASLQSRAGTWGAFQAQTPAPNTVISVPGGLQGRYVRVQLAGTDYLSLAEVQVIGTMANAN